MLHKYNMNEVDPIDKVYEGSLIGVGIVLGMILASTIIVFMYNWILLWGA